jgi:hypothetical protein
LILLGRILHLHFLFNRHTKHLTDLLLNQFFLSCFLDFVPSSLDNSELLLDVPILAAANNPDKKNADNRANHDSNGLKFPLGALLVVDRSEKVVILGLHPEGVAGVAVLVLHTEAVMSGTAAITDEILGIEELIVLARCHQVQIGL